MRLLLCQRLGLLGRLFCLLLLPFIVVSLLPFLLLLTTTRRMSREGLTVPFADVAPAAGFDVTDALAADVSADGLTDVAPAPPATVPFADVALEALYLYISKTDEAR